tara:strand:+ start:8651 stop:8950 length:300 start_codon:yes stop_codon:yes gene_type:complete
MEYFYKGKTQPQVDAEIINFTTTIYKIFGEAPKFSGSCLWFHKLLLNTFGGKPYYNSYHIITKIGKNYFDANGKADPTGYLPVEAFGEEYFQKAFKEYL